MLRVYSIKVCQLDSGHNPRRATLSIFSVNAFEQRVRKESLSSTPWPEHLTSVTNQSIQPAFGIARRGLVNSLLLDIGGTEIYPGGAYVAN
jgi:hypothetical protein